MNQPDQGCIAAASELHGQLERYRGSWFQCVGAGNAELIVYTATKQYPKNLVPVEWRGYSVRMAYMGRPKIGGAK